MFSRIAVTALAVSAVVAISLSAQSRPRKWWLDPATMEALAMTDVQSAEVERIFQESRPQLVELKRTLDALEEELSTLILNRESEDAVAAKIDVVEQARAEGNKARTLMLYRMHRVLSPEQDAKLKELFQRWERERRGRSSERRQ